MGADSRDRVSRIHELEMKVQQGIHQVDMVHRDEDARRYKLRALSLRDENAMLRDNVTHQKNQVSQLKRQVARLQAQLETATAGTTTSDARIKSLTDENGRLKLELEALKDAEQDSSKTLQEKFALERELNKLKPEMDHLKAQVSNHKAIVAEKQSLQRQIESLEVELENEKASKRKARVEAADSAMAELQSRLTEYEQQLASERREKDKAKKEHDKALAEAEAAMERSQERISTQKQKLKDSQAELKKVQAQLKSCQADLQRAQLASRSKEERPAKIAEAKVQPERKRRVEELSFGDVTIQTPGNDGPVAKRLAKKRGFERAIVGEKSTFSVTPFLSRSKDLSDESLDIASPTTTAHVSTEIVEEVEEAVEQEAAQVTSNPLSHALAPVAEEPSAQGAQASKPRGRPRTKPLAESKSSKKNMGPTNATLAAGTLLEKVVEEPDLGGQENKSSGKSVEKSELRLKGSSVVTNSSVFSTSDADGKKKKRKLLGGAPKTMFDDDEEPVAPKVSKAQLGPGRKLKAPLGGLGNAFAGKTFSPLKRDRRGVHASFLA